MGSCDVRIEFHKSGKSAYTSGDIISGNVYLAVRKSISLTTIDVKLEGISTSHLSFENPVRRNKQKYVSDVHKILYKTLTVFPPENVRNVSKAEEFTLTEGHYTYPFSFEIPLCSDCGDKKNPTASGNANPPNAQNFGAGNFGGGNFNAQLFSNTDPNAPIFLPSKAGQVVINASKIGQIVGQQVTQRLDITSPLNQRQGSSQQWNPAWSQGRYQNSSQESQGWSTNSGFYHASAAIVLDNYHVQTKLPPTFDLSYAKVQYFVKVTCRRTSMFKTNLRSQDPFLFLPLDDPPPDILRQSFIRKGAVFQNRLPTGKQKALPPPPPKKGFFHKLFDSSQPSPVIPGSKDVPFSFEVRFPYPAILKAPYNGKLPFNVYLITKSPAPYFTDGKSNGLGIIYFQKFTVSIMVSTFFSAKDPDFGDIHDAREDKIVQLCDNTYDNLKFDLADAIPVKSASATGAASFDNHEIQIPPKYFDHFEVGEFAPTFTTCNISRKYTLKIVGAFSADKIRDVGVDADKVKFVDLILRDVTIPSGMSSSPPPTKQSSDHKTEAVPLYSNPSGVGVAPEKGSDPSIQQSGSSSNAYQQQSGSSSNGYQQQNGSSSAAYQQQDGFSSDAYPQQEDDQGLPQYEEAVQNNLR